MAKLFNCSFGRVALREIFLVEGNLQTKYAAFNEYFKEYPKLHADYKMFPKHYKIIKNTFSKWRTGEERRRYIKAFAVETWKALSQSERKMHDLKNCYACLFLHAHEHVKFPLKARSPQIEQLDEELRSLTKVLSCVFNSLKIQKLTPMKTARLLLCTLDRSFQETFKTSFLNALKSPAKRRISGPVANKENFQYPCEEKRTILKQFKSISEYELNRRAVPVLLETKQSFGCHDRLHKAAYFEEKKSAVQRADKRKFEEAAGIRKPKRNSPDPDTLHFNKDGLLNHVKELFQEEDKPKINFSQVARQFGIAGPKGNMVVKEFLVRQGIDLSKIDNPKMNTGKTRRQLLKFPGIKMSLPHPKGIAHIRQEISRQITAGTIELGEAIVPRQYKKIDTISADGPIVQDCTVLGRKIPLFKIRSSILKRHRSNGWMRMPVGPNAGREELIQLVEKYCLPIDSSQTTEDLREQVVHYQTTRNLIIWIDHASLMNHGHLLITVNVMYDPLIYLTEEECFPNIQQMVEAPEIYMFGRSTDSIADKLSFIAERRIDLESLKEPVVDEVTNIQYKDRLRFFRGDHPEQQFEAGQTVGGKFPCVNCTSNAGLFDYPAHCFRAQHRSLQDRRNQVIIGNAKRVHLMNPFHKMKKADLEKECLLRSIWYEGNSQQDVLNAFTEHMAGIARVPALCFDDEGFDFVSDSMASYEVAAVEPLHDLKEHIKNLWEELPHILLPDETRIFQQTMAAFQKDMMRGCDYRLSLVTSYKSLLGRCREPVLELLRSLTEISYMAYCSDKKRTSQMVLRCYNQSYVHYCLCKELIKCKSLTRRKFFGTYLHAITSEFPLFLRYVSLQSLNTEDEERQFTAIKDISRRTSNRQPQHIIDNSILRMQARHNNEKQPKSTVSKMYASLPAAKNTEFAIECASQESFQAHCERISDFLSLGEGAWWERGPSSIIFKDASNVSSLPDKPHLAHFRSETMVNVRRRLEESWKTCIQGGVILPLEIIRVYDDSGKIRKRIEQQLFQMGS